MGKNKEAKDSEYYKGIIRAQKKEIRALKQRNKQLERFEYNYNTPREREIEEPLERLEQCGKCGKGYIKELDLMGRIFEVCSLCDYRAKKKVFKKKK